MDNNELKHYGILGMRWGVRRSKAQLARARGPSKTRKVTKEQYEAEKQKAIRSGNPRTVKAWQSRLDTKELRDAVDRVDLNKRLSTASSSSVQSGMTKVKSAITSTTGVVTAGLAAYGTVAKINNTFNKKQMPLINGTYYKNEKKKNS